MRKALVCAVIAAFASSACSDGTKVVITDEAPGENCAGGGVRLEIKGEVFYACEGDQTKTEAVAIDDPTNPCLSPALRVTMQVPGAEPRVTYVCEEGSRESDPVFVAAVLTSFASSGPSEIDCVCTADVEDRATCDAQLDFFKRLEAPLASCLVNAAALVPTPRPASLDAVLQCVADLGATRTACIAAIDKTECTEAAQIAEETCDMAAGNFAACMNMGTPAEQEANQAWMSLFGSFASLLKCPIVGGGGPI